MKFEQQKAGDEWYNMKLKKLDRERSKLKKMFYPETPKMFSDGLDDDGDMAPKTTKAVFTLNFSDFSDLIS